jgi:hypothetical protein
MLRKPYARSRDSKGSRTNVPPVSQAEAQVERGGHEAVGEGEDGWPARAGLMSGVAGRVAARPLVALRLPQGGELGDQPVHVDGGQSGQLGELGGAVLLLACAARGSRLAARVKGDHERTPATFGQTVSVKSTGRLMVLTAGAAIRITGAGLPWHRRGAGLAD